MTPPPCSTPTHSTTPSWPQAHYDDLKAEQDQTCQRLQECRKELEAARGEARTAAEQASRQGWKGTCAGRLWG